MTLECYYWKSENIRLPEERTHCESNTPCSRTDHNDPGSDLSSGPVTEPSLDGDLIVTIAETKTKKQLCIEHFTSLGKNQKKFGPTDKSSKHQQNFQI